MENKKAPNFFLVIIAIILGGVLYKQFDFKELKFEQPALAVIYIIVFLVCIVFLIRDARKK